MTLYALMQFIFSPVLGGISDRYGRRPVLLLSLLGLGIDYLFLSVAHTLTLLFIGRIIAGICGASFKRVLPTLPMLVQLKREHSILV